MEVVILGHICIDKNTSENISYTAPGGPGIFIYKLLSLLPQIKITIVSPYGKDFTPLAKDLPLFKTKKEDKTLLYENISTHSGRTQKAYNRSFAKPPVIASNLKDVLNKTNIFFFTPLMSNFSPEYIHRVESYLPQNTLKVLLPQGYYRKFAQNNTVLKRPFSEASKILPLFDVVVVSEEDGADMHTTAKKWSEKYSILSVVTMAHNGAVVYKNGKKILLPTKPISPKKVVDSVGCGDIFSASFAYAYKKTGDIEKSGKFANKIAGQRIQHSLDKIKLVKPILLNLGG